MPSTLNDVIMIEFNCSCCNKPLDPIQKGTWPCPTDENYFYCQPCAKLINKELLEENEAEEPCSEVIWELLQYIPGKEFVKRYLS